MTNNTNNVIFIAINKFIEVLILIFDLFNLLQYYNFIYIRFKFLEETTSMKSSYMIS